jgi:hypothetical protein
MIHLEEGIGMSSGVRNAAEFKRKSKLTAKRK